MLDPVSILIAAVLSVSSPSGVVTLSEVQEVRCMADNIYFEGRGEGNKGRIAIALVTMNRVESDQFPNTVCEVVKQGPTYSWKPDFPQKFKCQFSWYCDGKSDSIPILYRSGKHKGEVRENVYEIYLQIVKEAVFVMNGEIEDFTFGATHYFAYDLVNPKWAAKMLKVVQIQGHSFYRAQ